MCEKYRLKGGGERSRIGVWDLRPGFIEQWPGCNGFTGV